MAWRDLERFLVDLSASQPLKKQLKSNPDAAMKGYKLTAQEKKLVRAGDRAAIRKYLADKYAAALEVQVT